MELLTRYVLWGLAAVTSTACTPCYIDECSSSVARGCAWDATIQADVYLYDEGDLVTCDHAQTMASLTIELEQGSAPEQANFEVLDRGLPRLREIGALSVSLTSTRKLPSLRGVAVETFFLAGTHVENLDALGPPEGVESACVLDQSFDWTQASRYGELASIVHDCNEAPCSNFDSFGQFNDAAGQTCGFVVRDLPELTELPRLGPEPCEVRCVRTSDHSGHRYADGAAVVVAGTSIEHVDALAGRTHATLAVILVRNPKLISLQGLRSWNPDVHPDHPQVQIVNNPRLSTEEIESLGYPVTHCGNLDDDPCGSEHDAPVWW